MTTDDETEEDGEDVTPYEEMTEGFLTKTQRLYLADEKSYDNDQTERNKRQDIRDETRVAFLDFATLESTLDPKDRETIFNRMIEEAPEETIESLRDGESLRTATRHNMFAGAVAAIEFIYQGMLDAGIDPVRVINHVQENVAASRISEDEVKDAVDKIESGEELTPRDVDILKTQILEDSDEFREHISSLEIDIESIIHSATVASELGSNPTLSAGQSFAVLGYILEDTSRAKQCPDLPQLLHREVAPFARGDRPQY